MDLGRIQNSLDNLSETVLRLETEKNVIAIEVGVVEADMLNQVIESVYTKIGMLRTEIEIRKVSHGL